MEFKTKAEATALFGAKAVEVIASNCFMYSLTDSCTNCKSKKCPLSPYNPDNYAVEPISNSEVANEVEQIATEKNISIDNYDSTLNLIVNLVSADVLTMYNADGNLIKVPRWDITAIANAVILYRTDLYFRKHVNTIYNEWRKDGFPNG